VEGKFFDANQTYSKGLGAPDGHSWTNLKSHLFVQERDLERYHSVVHALPREALPTLHPIDLEDASQMALFHAGDRALMGRVYQETYQGVDAAVGRVLRGADRETVVQELYLRLLDKPELRRSFAGGSLHAWLSTLAHNQAVDFWRRYRREIPVGEHELSPTPPSIEGQTRRMEERVELRLFIDRFLRESLPEKWAPVFQARFVEQLDQRSAAKRLAMHRTTLAYQELCIRRLLRAFVRRGAP
jgi:RNA polymerase sigma-70 factor, ECF subfamily